MDHLRLVALPEDLRDSTEWIHVNLNNAPMSREMIYEWFLASATRDIESQHPNIDFNSLASLRAIYARPISEFEKGPLSLFHKESEQYAERLYEEIMRLRADKEISFECLLDHLYCGRNKLPIIVLDNCDKRLKDDQLLCFQVASWIKARFSCTVFLPIRDTTYDQYHSEPPLDTVIKDLVFRIDPPLLDRVVQKRLDYAVRQIDSDNRSFRYSLPDGKFVECRRQEVSVYLKSMVASIFQEATFKRIVAGLAGRNIRRGLEIFLDFCKSGHLGEAEIFKIRASNGGYTLPPHIVIKILMKGKRRYYSDSSAFIRNLFDSRSDDELPNPLLRADLLQWLKTHNRLKGPNRAKGFHKASIVLAAMQARGHAPMRVLEELGTLARTGCIRSEMIGEDISEEDLISIAPGGYVHLDLTRNVSFLSVVAEDTFFRVSDVAKRISENMVGSGRFRRDTAAASFDSAIALVQYLHDYENKFLPGTAKLLDEVASEGFFDLAELNSWLIRKAENQKSLAEVESNEREFPPGTIVEAQLTSIREFGMFVEFGAKGVGFVSRKSTGAQWHRWCNELEDGDFVSVEIVRYNHQHHKFDVALVDEG